MASRNERNNLNKLIQSIEQSNLSNEDKRILDDLIRAGYGCTDPNAINYNPKAQTDDGSCRYVTRTDKPIFQQMWESLHLLWYDREGFLNKY